MTFILLCTIIAENNLLNQEMIKILTEKEILNAQKLWGNGIVEIGKEYTNKQDYKLLAKDFIQRHYGYNEGIVLFKPTLASVVQFRDTFEKALSYFVAGNDKYPEDQGFAIRPWTKVVFENSGIIVMENNAIVMGNYFFTDTNGQEVKVEYTFGYFLDESGQVKIHLHHSSLPFELK